MINIGCFEKIQPQAQHIMDNILIILLTTGLHLYQTTAQLNGFLPVTIMLLILTVDAPYTTKECPHFEKDWEVRATEICLENNKQYHCLYDTNCRLVELCEDRKINYINIYLRDVPDNIFKIEENVKVYTNFMFYWMIQYPLCNSNFNTSHPFGNITEQVRIIEVRPWDYYLAWTLVGILVLLIVIYWLYVYRQHCLSILQSTYQPCLNYRQGQDSDKKENLHMVASSPPGIQPSRTVNRNGSSQNQTINTYRECNVDER